MPKAPSVVTWPILNRIHQTTQCRGGKGAGDLSDLSRLSGTRPVTALAYLRPSSQRCIHICLAQCAAIWFHPLHLPPTGDTHIDRSADFDIAWTSYF